MSATELRNVVGVVHVGGRYTFNPNWDYTTHAAKLPSDPTWDATWGSPNYLREGANEIQRVGTGVIKFWFHPNVKAFYWWTDPAYPYSADTDTANRLVRLAQSTNFYQPIFANPAFTTIVLNILPNTTDSKEEFSNGMTADEIAQEKTAMYNLAKYLLQTYQNSGKTFILQNWEADNMLDAAIAAGSTPSIAYAGLRDWTNARQDGVTQARQDVGSHGMQAVYAMEINHLTGAVTGDNCATNNVVQYTHCDLYSYSAWDARQGIANDDPDFAEKVSAQLFTNLNYLATKAPASALYGTKNIYIGEFGSAENTTDGGDGTLQKERLRRVIETALAWGVRYMLYWEVYANEPTPAAENPNNPNPDTHFTSNSDMTGLWLVRLDGSHPPFYQYLNSLMNENITHAGLVSANGFYVSAANGGGSGITVDRSELREWETIAIIDLYSRTLRSSDVINLISENGHYFSAADAGGSTVTADRTWGLGWEAFTIAKISGGGSLVNNDQVSFKTSSVPPYYLTATNGGGSGSVLAATSSTVGPNETFRLQVVEPLTVVCSYSITTPSLAFSAGGGTASIAVVANNGACTWTSQSSAAFATVAPAQATGNGTVVVTVAQNTGGSRSATITVAGTNFALTQGSYGAPFNLQTTPTSTPRVDLTWSDSSSATSYEIARSSGGAFSTIGSAISLSFSDSTVANGAAYVYKVRALRGDGSTSAYSDPSLATTVAFTDASLVAGSTIIKAVHLTELRAAVNLVRAAASLSSASFTDSAPQGVAIKAIHVEELRDNLSAARTAIGLPTLFYAHPLLTTGSSVVAAVDFAELRSGVNPIH